MGDSFSFGEPAKRGSLTKGPRPPRSSRSRSSGDPNAGRPALAPVVVLVIAAVVGIALIAGVLAVLKSGGESAADAAGTALGQVDRAEDAQAEVALTSASRAALVAVAEGGALDGGDLTGAGSSGYAVASAEALAGFDPSLTFTTAVSTGPKVVSVYATDAAWSAAVLSDSGTCLWIKLADNAALYGSGSACNGQAAMAAADPSW